MIILKNIKIMPTRKTEVVRVTKVKAKKKLKDVIHQE